MPQVSAAVLRPTPSSTSASASIRRAAALSFSPLAALRSSEAVRSSRVIDTAAPIDAAPLKHLERDEIRLGPFFCPGRSTARVLRAGVHSTLHGVVFAIFCPGPALHRRRDAMPGPGHEIVSASRLRDESVQLQHIML